MAAHHFRLAQKKSLLSHELETVDYDELVKSIGSDKKKELKSSLSRIEPHLFTKLFSFCDAPSLALSSGVNKAWREAISQCSELCQIFRMEGNRTNIMEG